MLNLNGAIDRRFAHAELIDQTHPCRARAEAYVADVYRQRFDAEIGEFMPNLLCFYRQPGELAAVVGLRCAASSELFCEAYLGRAVESAIQPLIGEPVSRSQVIEMGNFAANDAGTARRLILSLIPLLAEAGGRFVMFVATRQLRNAFARLGLQPTTLGLAEADRLGAAAGRWGRYYDEQPQVMFGDLTRAPSWATQRLDCQSEQADSDAEPAEPVNPLLQSELCAEAR